MFISRIIYFLFIFCFSFVSCKNDFNKNKLPVAENDFVLSTKIDTLHNYTLNSNKENNDSSKMEAKLIEAGLIDIQKMDSTIDVDLKYAGTDNFLKTNMYGNFQKCYLQKDVADKIVFAQTLLKTKFPYYSLIIFDGVRPRSVQYKMWGAIDVPYYDRSKYVSNPENASLHNFGAAVDLSIRDENGIELDMGTPYDYFGELAYPREEDRLFNEGKLTMKQLLNRRILRDIMIEAGFMPITTEWWHFNSCTRMEAYEMYKIIE